MGNMVMSIVGARPQFIKEAVVGAAARRLGAWRHVVVHSGQHYDVNMSDIFFTQLAMPKPDHFLGIGSGSHGRQTAEALVRVEELLLAERPDLVLVYGDTNTTVAGALAAAKLKIPVAHVEAGIRQEPKDMPEEINRVVTDHLADRLYCCSALARKNLEAEGLGARGEVVGDVMYDLFLTLRPLFRPENMKKKFGVEERPYVLATLHRDFNVDTREPLTELLKGFAELRREYGLDVVLPVHPRTRQRLKDFALEDLTAGLRLVEPLGYVELMGLLEGCTAVVTDSGGFQKEAYFAEKRALVMMPDTGWRELVEAGWHRLCAPDAQEMTRAFAALGTSVPYPAGLYGDGTAGDRVVRALAAFLGARENR